jgi:hypothetical protein
VDPRAHARLLARVRDAALGGQQPPVAPRPLISESWTRCRELDPGGAPDLPPLDPVELHRRREESGLAGLMPVLRARLLPVAEAAGQILVVADPAGRVLWREGGPSVRRRADALGFVEGSAWDESSVGTNAIGTSLVVDQAVHVYAGEHYAESHQPWTCAAAPVHDPVSGKMLGVVDLSGPAHTVHPSTVALVDAVCRLAALELLSAAEARMSRLRAVAAPLLARLPDRAVVVDLDGTVAAATGLALSRIPLPADLVPGPVALPGLGWCAAEPLPGGWLLRLDSAPPGSLTLDLAGSSVLVSGPSGEWAQPLGPRHAEILLALVRHPEGRSAAELSTDLFGDPSHGVTVRAEVSRLRRILGPLLAARPYRLTVPGTVHATGSPLV